MTSKNNRAPLLSNIKVFASFHHHMSLQTGVTVRKRLNWVLTSVTLTFDLWPWPFAWTSLLSLVITRENFMMIRWWEHSEKGVTHRQTYRQTDIQTDRQTDRQTDGQTDWTFHRAAWPQLKISGGPVILKQRRILMIIDIVSSSDIEDVESILVMKKGSYDTIKLIAQRAGNCRSSMVILGLLISWRLVSLGLFTSGRTSYRQLARSLEALRIGLILYNRYKVWQAPQQQRCRIKSIRYDNYNIQFRGFGGSWDLPVRRLTVYWIEARTDDSYGIYFVV